jgi:hypothetical protein
MRRLLPFVLLPALTPLLGGCLAKTAFDVVTAPVRVASGAVDLATTSQSEADENRGREIRRREERLARLDRRWREQDQDCRDGKADACRDRDTTRAEMDALIPTIPYEPERS